MEQDSLHFTKAIADETRQQIMSLICCQWLSVGEIVDRLNLTQPTISHHLAILRRAGLVSVREEGKQTFYTLNQEQLAVCCGKLVIRFAPQTETASTLSQSLLKE
ncbi:MAG: ArsR/SmtB family transcription factor [Chloroflexota bacterium]